MGSRFLTKKSRASSTMKWLRQLSIVIIAGMLVPALVVTLRVAPTSGTVLAIGICRGLER